MAENPGFSELRQKRLRYVESARENNFEEGLKSLLSELYPDNAHFIYELLQNAEDALASTVEFVLEDDRLTMTHDGKRSFSLADIESITGIGNSTKRDDPTQIGKFGVGFKAVFAYTTRPEVLSGEYSFAIEDLFVPTSIDGVAKAGLTTFSFPFDRSDKSKKKARREVRRGLSDLDEKTLLFLNHISTITYELPDGAIGIIERKAVDSRILTIKRSVGDDFVESQWLRLTGDASVDGPNTSPLTVAAAFKVVDPDQQPRKKPKRKQSKDGDHAGARWSIIPLDEGDVSIYFPAVKESSGLRFHIHAPFASTVARDSVRDDPGNVRLVGDIAKLITDALPELCSDGLIDDSFLSALPNEDDQIGHPYHLIRDGITEAFNDLEITPIRGTGAGFAAARTLVSSPSEFRNWLDSVDLPTLFDFAGIETLASPRWIRDRDGRAGKFLAGLDTLEFGWDELFHALSSYADSDEDSDADGYSYADSDEDDKAAARAWFSWLEAKSDDDLLRLYQLLGIGFRDHDFYLDLDDVPIVRLRKRRGNTYVRGAETYLPSGRDDTARTRVPINLAYFDGDEDQVRSNNLASFYRAAGVKRWDENARLEKRLDGYRDASRPIPDGDELASHLEDVESFARYALANPDKAKAMFSRRPFLLASSLNGDLAWRSPSELFVDLPYGPTGFTSLYGQALKDANVFRQLYGPSPVAGLYIEIDRFEQFLAAVGSKTVLEIGRSRSPSNNPQFRKEWYRNRQRGWYYEFIDYELRDLDRIIETGDHDLLHTLWRSVGLANEKYAYAVLREYSTSDRHRVDSKLLQQLNQNSWILDKSGDLRRPGELALTDLPDDWEQPGPMTLAQRLDFGARAAEQRQKQEGVTAYLRDEGLREDGIELLRLVKESGVPDEELRSFLHERSATYQIQDGASHDPVRRAEVAALDAIVAAKHTTSIRPGSVVDGQSQASAESKAYLRSHYTTPNGEMHCQACRKPLPFKTKDGSWYFEAVRFVTARKQVHTSNVIALCPLCAALYKYARGTKNEALLEQLANTTIDSGQEAVEIPVVLDGKRVKIAFTGKHAIDIKSSLGVAGDERDSE